MLTQHGLLPIWRTWSPFLLVSFVALFACFSHEVPLEAPLMALGQYLQLGHATIVPGGAH
jgi:hypothetical protein